MSRVTPARARLLLDRALGRAGWDNANTPVLAGSRGRWTLTDGDCTEVANLSSGRAWVAQVREWIRVCYTEPLAEDQAVRS